jgi:prepilin-type N-terminal cleavage/methylation domain-containing protein
MMHCDRTNRRRPAFTIIELLVVMAIMSILIALLMPAVQHAREAARRAHCRSNLHNIGLAILNYQTDHQCLPPGWLTSRVGNYSYPGYTSWLIAILPQIEQSQLFSAINANLPSWNPANSTAVCQRIELYLCPSDTMNQGIFRYQFLGYDLTYSYSNYVGNLGRDFIYDYYDYGQGLQPDGVLYRRSNTHLQDITDGTSMTLLAGERINEDPLCRPMWGFGATSVVTADSSHGISAGEHEGFWGFSSAHPPGAHFVMCDGSAGLVSRMIDIDVFKNLSTRNLQETDVFPAF